MSYLLKTRKPPVRSAFTNTVITLGVIVGIFFILARFMPVTTQRIITFIGTPLWSIKNTFLEKTSGISVYFTSRQTLERENDQLKNSLFSLQNESARISLIEQENETMKSMLGRSNKNRLLVATVLNSAGSSPYDTFLIDAGSTQGVKSGAEVYFASSTAAGYISDVFPRTSLVKLYSSPEEEVNVLVGTKHTILRAIGQGGGNFMITIPKDVPVVKGDPVIIPGSPSTLLGTIADIETDLVHAEKILHFRGPFNLSEVHLLFVKIQ